MKIRFEEHNNTNIEYTRDPTQHHTHLPFPPHEAPMPPHLRHTMLSVEFDEADRAALIEIFADEDTAIAAERIICSAPPEIQILTLQALRIYEEIK